MQSDRQGWQFTIFSLFVVIVLLSFGSHSLFAQNRSGHSVPESEFDTDVVHFETLIDDEPARFEQVWGVMRPSRASATLTWLAGGDDNALGSTALDLSTSFLAPMPWWDQSFLSISPSFGVQSLDAPAGVELPSELYRGSLSFSLMKPLSDETQLMVGLAPSFASDLNGGGSEAFRFMAFGNLSWQRSPTTKWLLGIAVTGREDIPVLPMAGLIWTPTEDWQIELTAPRPRISRRLGWSEGSYENWVYLAGEFGGGTWAVERAGRDDELTLRDFRLLVGWEQRDKSGMKALRHSHDRRNGLGPLHLVSAWSVSRGLSLGQLATEEKSNEITAIPKLIESIDLQKTVVTIDAAGCQKEIVSKIVKSKGDYVLALKGNQGTLHASVEQWIIDQMETDFRDVDVDTFEEERIGHGRRDELTYHQFDVPDSLAGRNKWKHLTTIGIAIRVSHEGGKETSDVRYFISSLQKNVKQFAAAVRGHWAIENTLHWCLDVTFREDESRVRNRVLADNLAWLKRFSISLLKQHPEKESIAMKRRKAGWNANYLTQVLGISTT